jgi:4-amino-4-deoxy-L-arabinose transferase-like glycosyltransferase
VGLPWYILVQLRNPQFFRVFILEHNFARFGTNLFHHPEPFWYYVPVTLLGWIPATIFVIVALVWAIRQLGKREADPMNLFLILWIAVVVFFFSLSQSKLPGYVLPAIPPGILLLANYLREKSAHRPRRVLIVLHSALAAALVFSAFALRSVLCLHRLEWHSTAIVSLIMSIAVGLSVGVLLGKFDIGGLRVATIVPAVITLAIALRVGAPALNETLSARAVTEALSQLAPKQLPVAVVLVPRETEFELQFYLNQKNIPRYELRQAPAGEHLVVARVGFKNAFARNIPGRRIAYLGNFPAQNLEFFYVGQ